MMLEVGWVELSFNFFRNSDLQKTAGSEDLQIASELRLMLLQRLLNLKLVNYSPFIRFDRQVLEYSNDFCWRQNIFWNYL
jgi:hypothetical protein